MTHPFTAVTIQSNVMMVNPSAPENEIVETRNKNLKRCLELIDWAVNYRFGGSTESIKVIGLPESFLHSFPRAAGAKVKDMLRVAIKVPGPETDLLSEKARRYNSYIFGATYEIDEEWHNRYFNCGFIISPKGDLILKYRKINCGGIETGTSPHEILDSYVKRYGVDALFPVVDTPIGKMGLLICADNLFGPEIARALAMRGAEILCYPISTTSPDHLYYHITAQSAALYNQCYLISPNVGKIFSWERAEETGGNSIIVNYDGIILEKASTPGETIISKILDINTLRYFRQSRPIGGIASIRSECFSPFYQQKYFPANAFSERPEESLNDEKDMRRKVLKDLYSRGLLVPPDYK